MLERLKYRSHENFCCFHLIELFPAQTMIYVKDIEHCYGYSQSKLTGDRSMYDWLFRFCDLKRPKKIVWEIEQGHTNFLECLTHFFKKWR